MTEEKTKLSKTNVEELYKVQMRTTVDLAVLVDACNVEQAIKKASAWTDSIVQSGESWFSWDDGDPNSVVGERVFLDWSIFQILCRDYTVRLVKEDADCKNGEDSTAPGESEGADPKKGENSVEPKTSQPDPEFLRELESMNMTHVSDHELRQRLLPCVVNNLNEHVIHTALDAVRELLTDVPEVAEQVLRPIFEWSEFWPNAMAREALGLPMDQDFETNELLERFELPAETFKAKP